MSPAPFPTNDRRVVCCLSASERMTFGRHAVFNELAAEAGAFDTTDVAPEVWREFLFAVQPEVLVTCWSTPPLPPDYVRDAGLRLRYVCHLVGSVKPTVPRALLERGVAVTNWGQTAAVAVAEHALLLILASLRRLPRWREGLLTPRAEQPPYQLALGTRSLTGRRVGLHGFGRIARHLVRLLGPFEVQISAFSEGVDPALMTAHGVRPCRSLEELFSGHEIVVECEALTPRTAGSVTANLLASLPPDATFVNVGRGAVIDEAALVRLAEAGRVRVALDVYADEPLPLAADARLLSLGDAILSPHIAGPTADLHARCVALAADNVARFLRGEALAARVTLEDYDRST